MGTVSHFLVAGREVGPYVGIATLAATEIGTITFMNYAELGYCYGFAAFVIDLISGSVMVLIGRTGLIIYRFRQLSMMTVPEYFDLMLSNCHDGEGAVQIRFTPGSCVRTPRDAFYASLSPAAAGLSLVSISTG